MLGADMRPRVPVALLFVEIFYFSQRVASGYSRRIELPRAVGTSPAYEILRLNPHQFGVRSEGLAAWESHHTPPIRGQMVL